MFWPGIFIMVIRKITNTTLSQEKKYSKQTFMCSERLSCTSVSRLSHVVSNVTWHASRLLLQKLHYDQCTVFESLFVLPGLIISHLQLEREVIILQPVWEGDGTV